MAIDVLRDQVRRLAAFDTLRNPLLRTLLLQGETGTGKGLLAPILQETSSSLWRGTRIPVHASRRGSFAPACTSGDALESAVATAA
jgi:hypothetical protein